MQVRASAHGQGGIPQYQLLMESEGEPVLEFESPVYQIAGSTLTDEVQWDLRAVNPGEADLRVSVNYEHTARCSDGSVVHSFTYASSPDVTISVAEKLAEDPTITLTPSETNVRIDCIFFDGAVSRTEADEYVQITDHGSSDQGITGWVLRDNGDNNQSFTFPGFILNSAATIRVYTNEVHPEWGGFSFGRGSSIWNNSEADTAILLDQEDQAVSAQTYDVGAPPGCNS